MENKTKKNTDYSASAVNLCNPPEVKALLGQMREIQGEIDNLDAVLKALPEYEQLTEKQQAIAGLRKDIEKAIEEHGSYQDVDAGIYGLKQRAVSKSYDAKNFEIWFPEYVPAVIVKAVNIDALKGLIKGGLITEEGLQKAEAIKETESFRFIIR